MFYHVNSISQIGHLTCIDGPVLVQSFHVCVNYSFKRTEQYVAVDICWLHLSVVFTLILSYWFKKKESQWSLIDFDVYVCDVNWSF